MRAQAINNRSTQASRLRGLPVPINKTFAEPARWKRCVPRLRSLIAQRIHITRGDYRMTSSSTAKRRGKKAAPPASRGGNGQGEKASARTTIAVQGARVHNLKNISLEIPRDSLIVVTGLS